MLGTRLAVFALAAAARPDRRRRGARPVVQAAGRRALFGARPGGLARPARGRRRSCSARRRRRSKPGSAPQRGRYRRLTLPARDRRRRACRAVRLVDMDRLPKPTAAARRRSAPRCAADAHRAQRIARGEQSLVFLNRRGYAPVLHCGDCGWMSGCPHCSAWRVFHKQRPHPALPPLRPRRARCRAPAPTAATPTSRRSAAAPSGSRSSSPALLPRRADRAHRRRQHAQARARSRRSSARCTPARSTCWSARRWWPRATTSAASRWSRRSTPTRSLFSSDFRAPERLFALLMQAAGRAGRDAAHGRGERDVGADLAPGASALRRRSAATTIAAFAASQLKERESAGLPPYSHLAVLRAEAQDGRGGARLPRCRGGAGAAARRERRA